MTSDFGDSSGEKKRKIDKVIADSKNSFAARRKLLSDREREGRELFTNADGEPIIRQSIVAYLDELGTSQRLSRYNNLQLREDLELYSQTRSLMHDDLMFDSEQQRALYFSDNIVVVEPIDPKLVGSPHSEMFSQLISVAAYQLNLAIRGRFLRGGIAVGDAYADSTFVTGPAHVQAVQLEETRADNPRVILSESSINIALCGIRDLPADESPYGQLLALDDDGQIFVNYLTMIFEDEMFDGGVSAEIGLIRHKSALESKLREFTSGKIFRKYRWSAQYHNHFVKNTHFNGRRDLMIGSGATGSFMGFAEAAQIVLES